MIIKRSIHGFPISLLIEMMKLLGFYQFLIVPLGKSLWASIGWWYMPLCERIYHIFEILLIAVLILLMIGVI
jgi:hypothetical protein